MKQNAERDAEKDAVLARNAKRINENHQLAVTASKQSEEAGRQAIRAVIVAGKNLLASKAMLEHGEWLPWLAKHCPDISERTCQRYMDLSNASQVTDLKKATSLRQAYIASGILKEDTIAKKTKSGSSGTNPTRPEPSDFVKAKGYAVRLWNLLVSTTNPERMAEQIEPVIQWHQDFVAQKQKRAAALNDGFETLGSTGVLKHAR